MEKIKDQTQEISRDKINCFVKYFQAWIKAGDQIQKLEQEMIKIQDLQRDYGKVQLRAFDLLNENEQGSAIKELRRLKLLNDK